jgi:mannose/fructose/N-acetylgalactosamine-specific phosphotransferase system component IIC
VSGEYNIAFHALLTALVGGILWLDRYQFLQIMISRPVCAAPIIGLVGGHVESGVAVGILFELLWLRKPPLGGYIPPDVTLASSATAAVASYVALECAAPVPSVVLVCFLVLFPICYAGRRLDWGLRNRLGQMAKAVESENLHKGKDVPITRLFGALAAGFMTAFLFLYPVILLVSMGISQLVPSIPLSLYTVLDFAYYAVIVIGVADAITGVRGRGNILLFFLGLAVSLVGGVCMIWLF